MEYFPTVVQHLEKLINTAVPPDTKLHESFTQWFVDQFGKNLKDHKEKMFALLGVLKHRTHYARHFLVGADTRDRSILDAFLPLFTSSSGESHILDDWFIQYVIQQFEIPLSTTRWADQRYVDYQNEVKTMFQDKRWHQYVSSFYKVLSGSLQEEQLLFFLNILVLFDLKHIKIVEEQIQRIASFLEKRSPEAQSAFFNLVLNRVFPAVKETTMKYLLFENFLAKEVNKLSGEFVMQILSLFDGSGRLPK
jgi:hypothetical protein